MFKFIKRIFVKGDPEMVFLKEKLDFFRRISNCKNIQGKPIIKQPTMFIGEGTIEFGKDVVLGYFPSPFFYTGNIHFDARDKNAKIKIGSNTIVNNNCIFGAFKANITLGEKCLLGTNIEIINADYHDINPKKRFSGKYYPGVSKDICIGNNVWIGNGVKILKGVNIGNNCVIGAGSIVTKDIPADSIAAGNPAKIIKKVPIT